MRKWLLTCASVLVLQLSMAVKAETLTEQSVTRFIASMEELQADASFSRHFVDAWKTGQKHQDRPGSLLLSDAVGFLEGREGYDTLEAVVESHGFDGPKVWGWTGDRALLALTRLEMADSIDGMQEKLEGMRREVRDNAQFSEQQKQRMLGMIDHTASMLDRMEQLPASDLDAVRSQRAELKEVLEYDLDR